ncbi:hypothetical protein [Paenibacillus sp. NPDC058071]|uniref:putative amidoligase domain-containing protein n=1 Tax=Paenibacillus sp. NPDC058071 TaxID=3346326 RepID=UPI0036D81D36
MTGIWIWDGRGKPKKLSPYDSMSIEGLGRIQDAGPGDTIAALHGHAVPKDGYPPAEAIWLNAHASEGFMMTDRERERRLARAGLFREQRGYERLYRVDVCQLEPIALRRMNKYGSSAVAKRPNAPNSREHTASARVPVFQPAADAAGRTLAPLDDSMLKRVVQAAIKGLYALGIDIGSADVAVDDRLAISVRGVRPLRSSPELADALLRYDSVVKASSGKPILLGADPEFALVKPNGRLVPASRYLGEGTVRAAGSDAMRIGNRIVYPLAELRPEPAEEPGELAVRLRRLLGEAARRIREPGLRWAAGAMPVQGLALGGHIHLSGTPLTPRLLRLLDSYAAFPLALVEDPAGRGRRPRYGSLGDFRRQPHGGFEYRTLPSWLVSPAAAKAALALALLCAREEAALADIPSLEDRYVEAYYAGDRAELAGCLDRVAAAAAATASYETLAPFIEPLFEAARRGRTWNEQSDLRVKWGIPLTDE